MKTLFAGLSTMISLELLHLYKITMETHLPMMLQITGMYHCVDNCMLNSLQYIRHTEILKILLENGADIHAANKVIIRH